jgi:epoxyqueuosine reductase
MADLLFMTQEAFRAQFKGSPVKRAKWRGLQRNAAAAVSAYDDPAAEAALVDALDHEEPLVREQAEQSLHAIRTRKMSDTAGRHDQSDGTRLS